MKRHILLSFALVASTLAALIVGVTSRTVRAQDEMNPHVCDSTIITLLYIAEYNYGFHSMEMDLSTFEKGQYAPLFDSMMAMMESDDMMATEDAMMVTEEAMMEGDDTMATEDATMEDMVILMPGNIEGEDPACTALREELDTFFYTTLSESMMMESDN